MKYSCCQITWLETKMYKLPHIIVLINVLLTIMICNVTLSVIYI